MTDTFFALVTDWGAPALAVATFLSCLALPVPTSLMMLAAGAFVATGDLALAPVAGAAFGGAVVGDQVGFRVGRVGGAALRGRLARNAARARLLTGAETRMEQSGRLAVFLTRWLFSPLGPYVNLLAGGARMGWMRFTLPAVLGEAIWVGMYLGLGFAFASQIGALADLLGNIVGLATSLLLAAVLGRAVLRKQRSRNSTV